MNPPLQDWQGQRVWLLGASSGIGAALASALLARGAKVAVSARRAALLETLIAPFDVGQACALPLDVTDAAAVAAAEQVLVRRWGGYDRVVMLAGDYQAHGIDAFTLAAARQVLETNLGGVYIVLAAVLPRLRAARAGGLVLVSSVAGYRGLPRSLAYGPSKAALNNLAEALYLELKADGVAVSVVNPGFVRTPLTANNPFPMPALIEASTAADAILAGLARGAFEIHFPRRFTVVMEGAGAAAGAALPAARAMADALNDTEPRVARICAWWEGLSPASLAALTTVYDDEVHFVDPFNDLHGAAALQALLRRMFERLVEPRFVVRETALHAQGAVLIWDFHYRLRGWQPARQRRIHGASHLRFGADGRVIEHRDYWDAAGEVYAHLPLLGGVLRWLGRHIG